MVEIRWLDQEKANNTRSGLLVTSTRCSLWAGARAVWIPETLHKDWCEIRLPDIAQNDPHAANVV
ncbi:MAG: hypothetical protein ACI96M_003530 [Candidatus Azotimanducaceae bacterium]|jgi:hypothetical protein